MFCSLIKLQWKFFFYFIRRNSFQILILTWYERWFKMMDSRCQLCVFSTGSGPGPVFLCRVQTDPSSPMWESDLEGLEEAAACAAEATGVDAVRQAPLCLRGTADKVSGWRRNGQSCWGRRGRWALFLGVCWSFISVGETAGGNCVYRPVKLSPLVWVVELGGCCGIRIVFVKRPTCTPPIKTFII